MLTKYKLRLTIMSLLIYVSIILVMKYTISNLSIIKYLHILILNKDSGTGLLMQVPINGEFLIMKLVIHYFKNILNKYQFIFICYHINLKS